MSKKAITTNEAPAALGPYSQGIIANGDLVFISGQVPVDPATGKLAEGGIEAQTAQSCKNLTAILRSVGLDASNVVKTTVFITSMDNFPKVNEIYKEWFPTPCPARSCVEIGGLPLGALVEIEAIAAVKKS